MTVAVAIASEEKRVKIASKAVYLGERLCVDLLLFVLFGDLDLAFVILVLAGGEFLARCGGLGVGQTGGLSGWWVVNGE